MYAKIAGTGGYLPKKVLTNTDLEKIVETTDEWIRERTGILKRHIVSGNETTSTLAYEASLRAMDMANVKPDDIDLIILATTTPDKVFPSTACLLQKQLNIHGCPAFDVQAVCTGFVYALDIANRYFTTNASKCALIVGSETLSRILDWEDRGTCVLFGDGAGAVILQASEEPGILSTHIHADGQYENLLCVPEGISSGYEKVQSKEAYIHMKGNEVFKMAVNTLGAIVDETLKANNLQKSDVDWLIPHQANHRIIAALSKKLQLPMEQVVVTVQEHGNTSAASVPLALDTAVRDGRINSGDVLMLEAFGGGFTWGSALIKY
jgi:3-oxoacyl-[acyl-carrier-protein] synthase-3